MYSYEHIPVPVISHHNMTTGCAMRNVRDKYFISTSLISCMNCKHSKLNLLAYNQRYMQLLYMILSGVLCGFHRSCVHSCKYLHSFQTSVYLVSMRLFPGETVAANTNNLVAEYIVLGCHFTSTYTDALTDQQLQCMPPSLEDMHICWTDELNTYFHFCVLAKASVKLVS